MDRKWKDLKNDEIYAIWNQYLRTDGLAHHDPLRIVVASRPMRLTPIEIIKLVDELLNRLEEKDG
jgi:hypothetical protein